MTDLVTSRIHQISNLERKCRDALQYDSVFKQVSSTKGVYEKICALLDFIGDSESALLSTVSSEQRRSLEPYFLAYGILQVMYSRQVAVRDVLKTLDLPIPDPLKTSALTQARDRVIGHPTTNDQAAHVIVRHSLSENGFEYWSYYPLDTKRGNFVDYEILMDAHLDAMEAGMKVLYQHIAKFENERRRQMRLEPLLPTLQGVSYLTQQLCAALVEKRYAALFDSCAESLLSALHRLRAGLVKRHGEEHAADEVDHVIEGVDMLRSLFPPKNAKEVNQYRVVADGVEVSTKHLIQMAGDIDELEGDDLT
jgi:hypothetical protein